ncbi:hypothetical protein [Brevundimonas sp.]|uniref:hypothetical protein n=1 Tax=Brevundimonas sp. TaxID=1871086 RepID=UPI0026005D45|nr:hypothetical protein [Brevundimonas sp.]
MTWKPGRGLLGPLKPLLGDWRYKGEHNGGPLVCTRRFEPFGKGWVRLDAIWDMPTFSYTETAFFGAGEDGALAFFSFTSDGKRSQGRLADGSDVHAQAVALEAQMPQGLARFIYWPLEDGGPGFRFAVESRTKKGWNRFLLHEYRAA